MRKISIFYGRAIVIFFLISVLFLSVIYSSARSEFTNPNEEKNDVLVIADFNDCSKPNKLGGDYGAWDKSPEDFTQTAMVSIMKSVQHGREGCAVQIGYDVISPNVAYNGFWMELSGLDASEYNNLNFWAKGDKERGFTFVFKVELKNSKGEKGFFYVTEVTDRWKKKSIPLDKFTKTGMDGFYKGLSDFSSLKEFVIVFEDRIATAKEGAIYIDDIYLSK